MDDPYKMDLGVTRQVIRTLTEESEARHGDD